MFGFIFIFILYLYILVIRCNPSDFLFLHRPIRKMPLQTAQRCIEHFLSDNNSYESLDHRSGLHDILSFDQI